MTAAPGGVLVVGYGNSLRTDDGVGPAVAQRLVADPRFRAVDVRSVHQLTPELALDASRVALLVLVDAAADAPPGAVQVVRPDTIAVSGRSMTHHLDPGGLAGLARELWGSAPDVVTVSVGVASLEVGDGLSPEVEGAVARAVEAVADVIREHADA